MFPNNIQSNEKSEKKQCSSTPESTGGYCQFDYECNQYIEPKSCVSTSEDSETKQYSDVEMENNNSMNTDKKVDADECMEPKNTLDENDKQSALERAGYIYHQNIAQTLQGEIFEAINTKKNNEIVVIKKALKSLVNENITIRHGIKYKIKEDIGKEIEIMKYLKSYEKIDTLPSEHIQLLDIFQDEECVYVVTEHGGIDFFQWVVSAHEKIESGELSLRYWRKNLKFLFKQMVNYVLWLHECMNICHMDISLENMLLQNGDYFYKTGKFTRSQQIKFCDFGLSEYFDNAINPSFACNKHVGKDSYMAPEMYSKLQSFDARQTDSWSLGVTLFIMMSGAPAYAKPDIMNDKAFQYIICQKIPVLLDSWGRLHYIDPVMLDLLQKIFILDPAKRLTVKQIKNHAWLQ